MIIFSVEKSDGTAHDNTRATMEATIVLGTYDIVDGFYKGSAETSFITNQVDVGRSLAKEYDQDCYLERGHYGYWYLIETKTDKILDTFKTIKEVSKEVAEKSDYYSVLNDRYYLASKY